MKKKLLAVLVLWIPFGLEADQVAISPAMSTLQTQIRQLNNQLANATQMMNAVELALASTQKQLAAVGAQVTQYADPVIKQFRWVDVSNNQLPENALVVAHNGAESLYICQANYSNGGGYSPDSNTLLEPGVVSDKGCVITYSGNAYLVPDYAVLTSNVSGYWISGDQVKSNVSHPPYYPLAFARNGDNAMAASAPESSNEPTPLYNSLAIIGGQENNTNSYICRVNIHGQYFVGKSMNNTCYIATGRYEANWPVYEVLLSRKP